MPPTPRDPRRHHRAALLVAAASVTTVTLTGTPAGAASHGPSLQTPAAYTGLGAVPVAPGVAITRYRSPATGGTTQSEVLTADLTQPGVRAGVLGGAATQTRTVAGWAASSGAVAAVNGDYFAITGSQAPQGPVVRGGRIAGGTTDPYPVVGQGVDGILRASTVALVGQVGWRTLTGPLTAYNTPVGSLPSGGGLAVFDPSWGSRPIATGHLGTRTSTLLLGPGHQLLTAAKGVPPNVKVPAGGAVVIATGRYAGMRNLTRGTLVRYRVGQVTPPGVPAFAWALGHGLPLVTAGKAVHNAPSGNTDPHASRTAVGWSNGGRTLLLVTSDRVAGSVGQGANEIADEMLAMGATDAVLLDGGGSTTLEARVRGAAGPTLAGGLQDGVERAVPNGIGVFVPKGDGRVAGMDVDADAPTVFSGFSRRLTPVGYDDWWGPATVNPTTVAWSGPVAATVTQTGTDLVRITAPSGKPVTVLGQVGAAQGTTTLTVLPAPAALLGPLEVRTNPGHGTVGVQLSGLTAGGLGSPVDASDVTVTADPSVVSASVGADGKLLLATSGGTDGWVGTVTFTAGGATGSLVLRSGYRDTPLPVPVEAPRAWAARGAALAVVPSPGVGSGTALKVTLRPGGHAGLTVPADALPAGSSRLGIRVHGDGRAHQLSVTVVVAGRPRVLSLGTVPRTGWALLDTALPSGTTAVTGLQVTGPSRGSAGNVLLSGLVGRS